MCVCVCVCASLSIYIEYFFRTRSCKEDQFHPNGENESNRTFPVLETKVGCSAFDFKHRRFCEEEYARKVLRIVCINIFPVNHNLNMHST